MRKYLLAAVAAVAISSPALARDGSPYVGIEGGLVIDGDLDLDLEFDYSGDTYEYDEAFDVDFKRGLDLDLIAGYDFGMFRLEGELGYKRLRGDKVKVSDELIDEGFEDEDLDDFGISENGTVWSLMANGLFDFGDDAGWNGYVGGGVGRARVKLFGERDSAFAWQFIAGARKAISPTIDLGLKYRYFRTGKLEFGDEFDSGDGIVAFNTDGKLRTHSLLASLIFNFAPPPPPPPPPVEVAPPPPPPPPTQTCPDGSVILAPDTCPPAPEPYVPPPPPPAEPERG